MPPARFRKEWACPAKRSDPAVGSPKEPTTGSNNGYE